MRKKRNSYCSDDIQGGKERKSEEERKKEEASEKRGKLHEPLSSVRTAQGTVTSKCHG